MLTGKVILNAPTGLHARPAGELVKLVKGFKDSIVKISAAGKTANAASMLSVLALGIKSGTGLEVSVEGGDERAVLDAVTGFIQSIEG